MTEDSAGDCAGVVLATAPHGVLRPNRESQPKVCPAEDTRKICKRRNDCWKRHSDPDHGESPFSGLGLALSGSSSYPKDTKNLSVKDSFSFPPKDRLVPGRIALGGRLGSYDVTGCHSHPLAALWALLQRHGRALNQPETEKVVARGPRNTPVGADPANIDFLAGRGVSSVAALQGIG